jgi:site-specific DNA-methyltransferase (adenine-specific)
MYRILEGDVMEQLQTLADATVDSIVTDPPYELGFMGKKWDATGISYSVLMWKQALRVLKPGGYLLAFGGSRTYHRLACAVEDAGFEIRDQIMWIYGSGFPKSVDVSKAIDKAAKVERAIVAPARYKRGKATQRYSETRKVSYDYPPQPITAPATDAAQQWQGFGTALKPAHEPIVVARKPLVGTVAANVLEYRTGALNIDACRISGELPHHNYGRTSGAKSFVGESSTPYNTPELGRWPANVIHDGSDEVLAAFPDAPGQLRASDDGQRTQQNVYGKFGTNGYGWEPRLDKGSAARFFKTCSLEDREWLEQSGLSNLVHSVDGFSCLPSKLASTVLDHAVSEALPVELRLKVVFPEPFTNVTLNELRQIATSVTETIQSLGRKSWLEQPPEDLTQKIGHVQSVVLRVQTGITKITTSLSRQNGSVVNAIFSIMPKNLEHGEKDFQHSLIYCAKASREERNRGCEAMDKKPLLWSAGTQSPGTFQSDGTDRSAQNFHPTVKPIALMAYLCRLVTPPKGTVLDLFMGSGSTGIAAIREGFNFIGIEMNPDYVKIAQLRIEADAPLFNQMESV